MQTSEIVKYAHALYRAHGDRAEYEAAQKAAQAKDEKEAETWRRVRQEIRQMRGANAS